MYEPIPSLNYKYEIDEFGKVRNAKTKQLLKPFRRTQRGKYVQVYKDGKLTARSIRQLLWEVHGIIPDKVCPAPVKIFLSNDDKTLFFPSLRKAAAFLSQTLYYEISHVLKNLAKRPAKFHGWKILYHEPEKRTFHKPDLILETKYFKRENKYWEAQKRITKNGF